MYDVLQFLHVASAIIWIGSGVCLVALTGAMTKAGDRATLMAMSRYLESLGPKLFGGAAMGTLLFGILTLLNGRGMSWAHPWIVIGLAGVAVSMVIVGLSAPVNKRLAAAAQEHGPDHADVTAALKTTRLYNYIDLAVLFFVVWAMVAKPGS